MLITRGSLVRDQPDPPGTGGLAQLGEHLLCKQGVIGSIPLTSTITEHPGMNARVLRHGERDHGCSSLTIRKTKQDKQKQRFPTHHSRVGWEGLDCIDCSQVRRSNLKKKKTTIILEYGSANSRSTEKRNWEHGCREPLGGRP